jgi:N-methylhydantoinase B/oxoprolinase/acetone carboxylase alpha subunit
MSELEPVRVEIIRNALVSAAEGLSVAIWRTSRSSVVREILDYSTCVFDAGGHSVAQAARHPAPVANRMAVGHRIVNAVMGAFAQALPDQVPAAYYGVSYAYALNAENADGSRQVYFDLECGG